MIPARLLAKLSLAALLTCGAAAADTPARTPSAGVSGSSLLNHFGTAELEQSLRRSSPSERERALSRLGALGTPRAVETLVRALDPNGAAQSPREQLLTLRALARHAKEAPVRECLVRVMSGISASAERAEPLYGILRDTAALSLSASGDPAALEALGKALRQPGRVARSAAGAIVAHPPADLTALLRARYAPTKEMVDALEALGDARAFELLRDVVRRGAPELRARAAVALTRLGNFETVELALGWAKGKTSAALRLAAAEILLLAHDPRAADVLVGLLAEPEQRGQAIELMLSAPRAALTGTLLDALANADPSEQPTLLTALGRSGGDAALDALAERASDARFGDAAVYALALSWDKGANQRLERLLADPRTLRRAARAGALRASATGEHARGLGSALARLFGAKEARDRAVGAFGLSLLDAERAAQLVQDADPVVAQAAARASLGTEASLSAARRLLAEKAGPTRSQLALALADPRARALVPTRVLSELAAEGGVATPIALFALAERDNETLRARLLDGLGSFDPRLRAQTALGLGGSASPSALALLESAYTFEPEAAVRRAVVRALARRPQGARARLLELARNLDPDVATRESAALAGFALAAEPFAPAHGTLWLNLDSGSATSIAAAGVEVPGGLVLPVLADPDGVVSLANLPVGSIDVRAGLEPRTAAGR